MKYQILHDFRTSTPFKEKSSDHSDLLKLKLLTNLNANLTSFLGGIMNYVVNVQFVTRPSVYGDL